MSWATGMNVIKTKEIIASTRLKSCESFRDDDEDGVRDDERFADYDLLDAIASS
jgi:hypothetical protein